MNERTRNTGRSHDGEPNAFDVVSLVDDLLTRGVACGASDIHFEPTSEGLVVKFRLDGMLSIVEALPKALAENVIARLKVLGGLLTYRMDIPQEGRIEIPAGTAKGVTDQRVSIFPTIYGQRAVVRLFYEETSLTELSQLGLPEAICTALKEIAAGSQGILLLTGPAGSGKSTTLAAILRHTMQQHSGRSVVTLEDPVERRISGATQVQITPHGEMTFPTALRSLLRQDPEVLMIGEIRDAQTARIAIEAGLTGHLLMSTLHSGTPAGALLRLLEMGVEPYQITSSVLAVVSQRLLRRLCLKCRRPGDQEGWFEPVGCDECFGTGFYGRALIAEMIRLDGELRKAVLAKADADEMEGILDRRGHMNMNQSGMRLVADGVTTLQELRRICPPARGEN